MPTLPEVRASVHPGGGKAAYFADLTIGPVTILGCPVWNGTPGFYKLAMPAKKGDKDKWFRIVELDQETFTAAECAVLAAIDARKKASGG